MDCVIKDRACEKGMLSDQSNLIYQKYVADGVMMPFLSERVYFIFNEQCKNELIVMK